MRVALVYDRVNKWGGAERVLLSLNKIFPEADLYTSVYDSKKANWAKVFNVKYSFLQKFPKASSMHEAYAVLMPFVFESFNFDAYDLVISVTSESAKGIITKPDTLHICYCLTPTRYLWSGYKDYFKNPILRVLGYPAVSYLRKWDKIAAFRPDEYIAISTEVKNRIKKYYNRESTVIYPPLQIENRKRNTENLKQKTENLKGGYFLVVSRLTNYYKRVDIAIRACNELKLPLKIVGTGRDENYLKKIAGTTVEFLGKLTDDELSFYYKNCKALIFTAFEDFGLAMVEAQSFGKPVIALRGAGALDIVIEGKTGEFFDNQTPESLIKVLEKFNSSSYNTDLCEENAGRFSFENFKKQLLAIIDLKSQTL